MITQSRYPRTPLDLKKWGRGRYFKAGGSHGENKYNGGFAGFGIVAEAILAGSSIVSAIIGRSGRSADERQALWMEFMQRQSDEYRTQQTLLYGVLPAVAILGGILLLRK
ncbi:hypothetical protein L0244_22105 [bacterium]|nr:hypothetical protein [bacterium]